MLTLTPSYPPLPLHTLTQHQQNGGGVAQQIISVQGKGQG